MKIIETDKLSPCPFCGGEVELQDHTDAMFGFWDYKVKCKHCRTEMRSPAAREKDLSEPGRLIQICNETTKRKALDELIEDWNHREEGLHVHLERLQACGGEMTYSEALNRLIKHKAHHAREERFAFYIQQALELACSAIKKQIPKAPEEKAMAGFEASVASRLACPTCGEGVTNYWAPGTKPKHCQCCGQALDWGEEAEK